MRVRSIAEDIQQSATIRASSPVRFWVLALVLMAIVSYTSIWLIFQPHWHAGDLVPPGDDPIAHLVIIEKILNGQGWLAGLPYPPLFHWIVAALAFKMQLQPLQALWPILIALIGLVPLTIGGWVAIRLSRGSTAALLVGTGTLIGLVLLSRQPLQAWGDGNYPNLLAEAVLIPILILILSSLHERWHWGRAAASLFLLGLVFLTHAMSTLVALIVFTAGIALLKLPRTGRIFLSLGMVSLAGIAFMKAIYPVIRSQSILDTLSGQSNLVPGLSGAIVAVTPLSQFDFFFGPLFWSIFGLLVALGLILYLRVPRERPTLLMLFIWFAALFFISRISSLGVPDRFLRDLNYPMIALGVGVMTILAGRHVRLATALAVLICSSGILFGTFRDAQPGTFGPHPDGLRPIVQRVDGVIARQFQTAAELIPPNARISANLTTSYLPFLINRPVNPVAATYDSSLSEAQLYFFLGPIPGGLLNAKELQERYETTDHFLRSLPATTLYQTKDVILKRLDVPLPPANR